LNITKNTENVSELPLKKVNILKYNDYYIEYGFIYLNENGIDVPQYFICSLTLANASIKQNKLVRHLEINHIQYKRKTRGFLRKLHDFKQNKKIINTYATEDKMYVKCSCLTLCIRSGKPVRRGNGAPRSRGTN